MAAIALLLFGVLVDPPDTFAGGAFAPGTRGIEYWSGVAALVVAPLAVLVPLAYWISFRVERGMSPRRAVALRIAVESRRMELKGRGYVEFHTRRPTGVAVTFNQEHGNYSVRATQFDDIPAVNADGIGYLVL